MLQKINFTTALANTTTQVMNMQSHKYLGLISNPTVCSRENMWFMAWNGCRPQVHMHVAFENCKEDIQTR
jgi:hypothetical protein